MSAGFLLYHISDNWTVSNDEFAKPEIQSFNWHDEWQKCKKRKRKRIWKTKIQKRKRKQNENTYKNDDKTKRKYKYVNENINKNENIIQNEYNTAAEDIENDPSIECTVND